VSALQAAFGEQHVAWAAFTVVGAQSPDWMLQHLMEGTRFDLSPLFLSDAFRAAVPALAHRIDPDRTGNFDQLNAYALSGSLAEALAAGGERRSSRPAARDAHVLALDFVEELLGARFADAFVLYSRAAWSTWFSSDVWDRTWIVADCAAGHLWLLSVTDGPPPRRRH